MDKAIIIARCSTNELKQDVNRQVDELQAKYRNLYNIVEVKAYYQSGTKNQEVNKDILSICKEKGISTIIVSEISRISRKVIDFLQFVEVTNKEGINIVIDNHGLTTLNEDGTVNQMTKIMLTIGASFAEMELATTVERLNSGRAKYIKDGGKLGRNEGSKETTKEFLDKHKDISKLLKQGMSIRKTAKLTDKSPNTVQKVKKLQEM